MLGGCGWKVEWWGEVWRVEDGLSGREEGCTKVLMAEHIIYHPFVVLVCYKGVGYSTSQHSTAHVAQLARYHTTDL